MAPRQGASTATTNAAVALARAQTAHRLKQLHELTRGRQHEALMRQLQHRLHAQQALWNEQAARDAEPVGQSFAPAVPMGEAPPVGDAVGTLAGTVAGNVAPIGPGPVASGPSRRSIDAGGMAPLSARLQGRRGGNDPLSRPGTGMARSARLSFEGVALQSLLDDLATDDDAADAAAPRGITRQMIGRARAVASAMGLTPIAQRRLAALAPAAGAARRALVEAAFEGLLEAAAEGREFGADRILRLVHDAMSDAGMGPALQPFTAAQTRAFLTGLRARHPASVGVLAMSWLVDRSLEPSEMPPPKPDTARPFGQRDVLAAISAALAERAAARARPALSRPDPLAGGLGELLRDIRLGAGEGQPLGTVLRLVLGQLDARTDAGQATDDELRAALPRLRELLADIADIAENAPSVEEAFVLRELLDRIGSRPAIDRPFPAAELDMATYHGLGRQQRQLDAGAVREREDASLWQAIEHSAAMLAGTRR